MTGDSVSSAVMSISSRCRSTWKLDIIGDYVWYDETNVIDAVLSRGLGIVRDEKTATRDGVCEKEWSNEILLLESGWIVE